jgi:hypothetical protein
MRTCQFGRAPRARGHCAILKRAASIFRPRVAALTLAGLAVCSARTSPKSTPAVGAPSSAKRLLAFLVPWGGVHVGTSIA